MGRTGDLDLPLGRRWGRPAGRWSDVYGRPRRFARVVALLVAATTVAMSPSDAAEVVHKELHRPEALAAGPAVTTSAASTGTSTPQAWPIAAWLERGAAATASFQLADGDDAVMLAPSGGQVDQTAAPTEPAPAALASSSAPTSGAGGVWAVAIGINDYPGRRSDLRAAGYDARDVDAVLARFGVPASQRLLILDRQASASTIRASLDWLVAHAGPDSTAVFYYAGHVRELSRTTEAIVAADGELITDADVAAHLAPLRSAQTWLAFASCFGAGFDEVLAPGRVLTAASDGDSLAYENHNYKRSYLGEYLVRRALLHGAADGSIQQAFRWAEAEIRRDHPNRVPVMIDHAGTEVTLGSPSPPPASSPPPPPSQQSSPPPSTTTTTEPERGCAVRVGSLVTCSS